jgi:hypothetical protein
VLQLGTAHLPVRGVKQSRLSDLTLVPVSVLFAQYLPSSKLSAKGLYDENGFQIKTGSGYGAGNSGLWLNRYERTERFKPESTTAANCKTGASVEQ